MQDPKEHAVIEEEENLHPYSEPLTGQAGLEGSAETPDPLDAPSVPAGAPKRRGSFFRLFRDDHPYVLLGTSALAACVALMSWNVPGPAFCSSCYCVFAVWWLVSLVALAMKLAWGRQYRAKSPFCTQTGRTALRIGSYVVWAAALVLFCAAPVANLCETVAAATQASTKPEGFLDAMIYMLWNSRQLFLTGVLTTVELAFFGTIIAFFLALLLVFLRIQTPDRSDNDGARFFKWLGVAFAKVYSTVVRGTPMMVQGLIIWMLGLAILRGAGLTTSEVNGIWTPFWAGLVTISLNSTAYLMEVLRGGIEAVDPGQLEAARSLGLSQWQAMRRVVFPQGIKNSIPALSNELIVNIKDSSVLSVFGVFDLMFATTSVVGIYFSQLENYVTAALIYLVLTMAFSWLLTRVARAFNLGDPGPVGSTTA